MKQTRQKLTKSQRKKTVRYLAMKILVACEQENAFVNIQLSHVLNTTTLSSEDSALLTELVYGVTQRKITIDYVLQPYIKKDVPMWLQTILRLSVFQLYFLDKIPAYAVLNEASELTRLKAGQTLVNFVNAVLRNVVKNKEKQQQELDVMPLSKQSIHLKASMPMWLVSYFVKRYGLETTYELGMSLVNRPALSVRVVDEAIRDEIEQVYGGQKSDISPVAYRMPNGKILSSHLFTKGKVTVQDESSTLVALVGNVAENWRILDTCAAPGGKSTHIASFLNEQQGGYVQALDLYPHKLQLIKENAKRLGVSDFVKTQECDARFVHEQFDKETFDAVFVDAPCSGLGLMRRKPDIKYAKQQHSINELVTIQKDILSSATAVLKRGGTLIYSTCTITTEENQKQIETFLTEHDDFKVVPLFDMGLPKSCYTKEGYIEILPHLFETDGFFIAKLVKH